MASGSILEATRASCLATQQEELDALESIYGEKILTRTSERELLGAKLTFPTRLPHEVVDIKLKVAKHEPQHFQVNYLPPIFLDVVFPLGYPELEAPRFVLRAHWLSPVELSRLCARLDDIWKEWESMMIVFNWVDFLENELLNYLGISKEIDLNKLAFFQKRLSFAKKHMKSTHEAAATDAAGAAAAIPKHKPKKDIWRRFDCRAKLISLPVANIAAYLRDYNVTAKREHFENSAFECNICFSKVAGKEATMFNGCGHAFCNECTSQHIRTQMDGGLENGVVTCMEPGCGSEILGSEVKRLIGEEHFERYDELLLKRYLNSEKDIKTCARRSCEKPVIVDPLSSIATCAECNFSFCTDCRRASHGINPCILSSAAEKETLNRYLQADAAEREMLEKKYSKKYLRALVADYQSDTWIANNSKKCPQCRTDIEKSEGCNKMTCWKCQTKFCYLCGKDLDRLANPYTHFNVAGSLCYMRLFENIEDEDNGDADGDGAGDTDSDDDIDREFAEFEDFGDFDDYIPDPY